MIYNSKLSGYSVLFREKILELQPFILSYWAWAKQHQGKRYRTQALCYLDKAIDLDPHYEAGRKCSKELKNRLLKK